jgi:hypothetical protein
MTSACCLHDLLCNHKRAEFGTNWIYVCYVEESRPPLWSSGQSSRLQIQRSGFDFRLYQIFWEVLGLKRGPFRLVSTIEELLGRKSSSSGLENRDHGRLDPRSWPRGTLFPQDLTLTLLTSGGRSVGIVHSRSQATEFFFVETEYLLPCSHLPILVLALSLKGPYRRSGFYSSDNSWRVSIFYITLCNNIWMNYAVSI